MDVLYLGSIKPKCAFERAQNVQIQIILRMRKVSSGLFLSILHSVVYILWADREGPDKTARMHQTAGTDENMKVEIPSDMQSDQSLLCALKIASNPRLL